MPAPSSPVIWKPFAAPVLVPVNCRTPCVAAGVHHVRLDARGLAALIALAMPAADWSALMSTGTGVPAVNVPSASYVPG